MLLKQNQSFKQGVFIISLVFITFIYSCSGNGSINNKTGETTEVTENKETTNHTPVDACALLTEAEAKAALNGAVTKGMSTATMCQYLSASDELSKAGESVSIQLNYGQGSEYDSYTTNLEKDLNVTTTPVNGVGDKAVFAGGQLIVLKDQNFMTVIVGKKMNEEQQIAAEKEIAKRAIERLAAAH